VGNLKNEKLHVFSGESIAGNAGHLLQMCEAGKKVARDSIRRGVKSAGMSGERLGEKRCNAHKAVLGSAGAVVDGASSSYRPD
jgi:hypothetical protein